MQEKDRKISLFSATLIAPLLNGQVAPQRLPGGDLQPGTPGAVLGA